MTLPAPKLDDRSFQDLVDDAKRFIQERCPEWTDHNVSDPGVTLIETFAWMTDLLLYRLNRVPERVQLKFLDMVGLELFPPSAATVDVDLRLAAPQDAPIVVTRGTVVSTARDGSDPPVDFTTTSDLRIDVASLVYVGVGRSDDAPDDRTNQLGLSGGVAVFGEEPEPGDALYLGFDELLSSHSVQLRFECVRGAGAGISSTAPPLRFEALVDGDWTACEWLDRTRGFNVDGTIEVHVPAGHQMSAVDSTAIEQAALLRCVVTGISATDRTRRGMTPYRASPEILSVEGHVIGATVEAVNARFVESEIIGESAGVAGQEFQLQHAPVVISDEAFVLTVARPSLDEEMQTEGHDLPRSVDQGWEEETWELVSTFAESGPDSHHFVLDRATGTLRFGPMVREQDGGVRHYGGVPPKGAILRVPRYRVGGGRRGNVASGAIQVLRTSIPSIGAVTNRSAGVGGADGETVEEGVVRGPIELRTRNRAVTAEDFEILTREADPQIRRVRCIVDEEETHAVRVLMVPTVGMPGAQLSVDDLEPSDETSERVKRYLDERRLVGTRVRLEPPEYAGLRVRARILVEEHHDPVDVREAALGALYEHFDPLIGGRDGSGWEFGRAVRAGEIYSVMQRVSGVDVVDGVSIAFCDAQDGTGEEDMGDILELFPNQLVLSREHEVEVVS